MIIKTDTTMLPLQTIEKKTGLTRESFGNNYLIPQKPVVFTDFMNDWPAKTNWSIENLKKNYGHLEVPVVSPNHTKPGKGYMVPELYMSFGEYLTLIERGPMQYRIFLWNVFKYAPDMCHDYKIPTIMDGFLKDFPFMFFGGQGSITPMHYDIDMSHVFLNQLHGRKRVILFAPDQSRHLYQHPFAVASSVDINNLDFEKYPATRQAKGYEVILDPGDTIFIPSGYWHYIEYVDGGYSIALRANESYVRRVKGAYNIASHYVVNITMNNLFGKRWHEVKELIAKKRAEEHWV
jgi:Cupin-like domain